MTDTSWPNPERPGVPMFPDRNGEHKVNYMGIGLIALWSAEQRLWWVYDTDEYFSPAEAETVFTYYHGPILTPTQISDMLAGERERCAQKTIEVSNKYYFENEKTEALFSKENSLQRMLAASECTIEIRNLGAAS